MRLGAIVLAAGAGRRFGGPKALVSLGGELLVERAVRTAAAGGCKPIVVVIGSHADQVLARADIGEARTAVAENWDEGMGASLRAGLEAVEPLDCDGVAVLLVDQPHIGSEALHRLQRAWEAGAVAAVATYDGARRNPAVLDRSVWAAVSEAAVGDVGARGWMRDHSHLVVDVPCDGTGDAVDIDTQSDLAAAQEAP
jgi:nicotine blue oxidoreductase